MAEIIRPVFDVVRGWAGGGSHGSAYDRTFSNVQDGSSNPLKVKEGIFLTLTSTGAVVPCDCPTGTAKSDYQPYLVVEGNDPYASYSGDYLGKVVAIRGSFEVLLSQTPVSANFPTAYNMFVSGAYTPGAAVTLANGFVKLCTSGFPKMGFVTEYNAAALTLKVSFDI